MDVEERRQNSLDLDGLLDEDVEAGLSRPVVALVFSRVVRIGTGKRLHFDNDFLFCCTFSALEYKYLYILGNTDRFTLGIVCVRTS